MNSASLCSLAGRYDNRIPAWFLAPIKDCLKIPAQYLSYRNAEPIFVNLLRSPGNDSHPGGPVLFRPKPEFVNIQGAQESIPPGGELIPHRRIKRFTNTGSERV
jgi:hypothetical protein